MKELSGLRTPLAGLAAGAVVVGLLPWLSGGQEPVAVLISLGAALTASLLLWRAEGVRRLPWRWTPVLALALLVWATLSLVWSINRFQTVQWVLGWGLVMLAFGLSYRAAEWPRARQWFVRAYLASTGLMVGYGLYLYLTTSYERFTSSFYWANPAAAYLIPALILLMARLATEHKSKWKLWLRPLAAGLIGAAFWLAASRGATLVVLLVSLILIVTKFRNKVFWVQLLLTILAGMLFVISINYVRNNVTKPATQSASTAVTERLAEAARGEATSLVDRANYLKAAGQIWLDHPVQGTGAGTYSSIHPRYQGRVISAASSAHNVYVQTLAELGLVGGVLLALVVLFVTIGVIKSAWYDPAVAPLALGFAALVIHFGLDIDASYPALIILAAGLAGFSYKVWEVRRQRPGWIMPLVSVALLVPAISLYQSRTWANNAVIVQEDDDLQTAREWYGRAHTGLVYNPDTLTGEGIIYFSLALAKQDRDNNLRLALDRARSAQKQDPADGQHWYLEGRALALGRQSSDAMRAFGLAIERDPFNHPEYYQQLALVQLGQGQPQAALATATRATDQYPDDVLANRHLDPNVVPTVVSLYQIKALARGALGDAEGAKRESAKAAQLIEAMQSSQ